MLARNARSMGRSQEAQELSSSGTPGTEPQDFGPRSLVPVRSSSASSPVQIWTTEVYIHSSSSIVSTCPAQNLCLYSYVFEIFHIFTDVIFLQHLPGITRVSNILKVLCRVHTSIFYQNLLTPRMLKNYAIISHDEDIIYQQTFLRLTSSRNLVTS